MIIDKIVFICTILAPNGPSSVRGVLLMPVLLAALAVWTLAVLLSFLPLAPLALLATPKTVFSASGRVPEHWSTDPFLIGHRVICRMWGLKQNNT